jgi:hypothetical protein
MEGDDNRAAETGRIELKAATPATRSRDNDGSHDSTSVVRLWLGLSSVLLAPAAARLFANPNEGEASGGFPRVACHRRHQRNERGRRRELQEQLNRFTSPILNNLSELNLLCSKAPGEQGISLRAYLPRRAFDACHDLGP